MAKKKITYDVFVRVTVSTDVDPSEIESVLHSAASGQGWDFSSTIEQEDEGSPLLLERLLEDDD